MDKPTAQKCELCNGTKFYGNNGPGRRGNREYVRCEICNPDDAPPASKMCHNCGRQMSWGRNTGFFCVVCPFPAQPTVVKESLTTETMSNGLDQLHDELANALLRFVQANQGLMNATNKHQEGVAVAADVETYGEALGNATALAEDVLRKYAAVAAGELEPPPKHASETTKGSEQL